MKKLLIFSFSILIFSVINLYASGEQNIKLKPGTKLIYSMFRNGNYSSLIVTVHSVFPSLSFSYQTTFDPSTKGDVTMTRDALTNADHIVYYLLGQDLNLKNATTLWFSKKSYDNLKSSGKTEITNENGNLITLSKLNNSVKKIFLNKDTIYVNFMNAAQVLSGDSSEIEYGDMFQILDDQNNPMILKMNVGWTVELKRVIYPESDNP